MKRLDLLKYIGLPFELNARGPGAYDCYGLIQSLCYERGFFLPDQDTPESIEMRRALFDEVHSPYLEPIDRPEPYCLVVFDFRRGGLHLGMVTEDTRKFIHISSQTKAVIVNRLRDSFFERQIYGFFRAKNPVCRASKPA